VKAELDLLIRCLIKFNWKKDLHRSENHPQKEQTISLISPKMIQNPLTSGLEKSEEFFEPKRRNVIKPIIVNRKERYQLERTFMKFVGFSPMRT